MAAASGTSVIDANCVHVDDLGSVLLLHLDSLRMHLHMLAATEIVHAIPLVVPTKACRKTHPYLTDHRPATFFSHSQACAMMVARSA